MERLKQIERGYKNILKSTPKATISETYQRTSIGRLRHILKALSFILGWDEMKDKSLIDIGAGYGRWLYYYGSLFKKVRGIEHDEAFVNYCLLNYPGIDMLLGDLLTEDFTNTILMSDIIYTFNITWDIQDKGDIFLPIIEKMKPGHILIEAYDTDYIIWDLLFNRRYDIMRINVGYNITIGMAI